MNELKKKTKNKTQVFIKQLLCTRHFTHTPGSPQHHSSGTFPNLLLGAGHLARSHMVCVQWSQDLSQHGKVLLQAVDQGLGMLGRRSKK